MSTASESLSADSFLMLPNGRYVRAEAMYLLDDLWARGIRLSTDEGDIVIHRSNVPVTEDDRAALRRLKPHCLALLDCFAADGGVQ
jgi:hypothetical protein